MINWNNGVAIVVLAGATTWQATPSSLPPTGYIQEFQLPGLDGIRVWQATPSGDIPPVVIPPKGGKFGFTADLVEKREAWKDDRDLFVLVEFAVRALNKLQ